MPLCTEAQVEAVLRADITAGDVDDLIDIVSGYLEGYIGRTFEESEITVTLTGERTSDIYAPHWPLGAVGSVTEDGVALVAGTTYNVDLTFGRFRRLSTGYKGRWGNTQEGIELTYTPALPGDLVALAARIVARIYRAGETRNSLIENHPEIEGLTQLTVGRWSATVASGGGQDGGRSMLDPAAAFDLTEIDMHILDGYIDRTP